MGSMRRRLPVRIRPIWDLLVLLAQIRGVALVFILVAGGSGGFVSAAAGLVAAAQPAIGRFAAAALVIVGVVAMLVSAVILRRWLRDPRVVRSGLLGNLTARLEGVRQDGDDLVAALTEPKGSQTFLSSSRSKDLLRRIEHWHERATDLVPPKHRPAWERIWSDTFGDMPHSQSREDLAAHERAGHEWRVRRALDLLRTIRDETPPGRQI
jgi:hypothetical protein